MDAERSKQEEIKINQTSELVLSWRRERAPTRQERAVCNEQGGGRVEEEEVERKGSYGAGEGEEQEEMGKRRV